MEEKHSDEFLILKYNEKKDVNYRNELVTRYAYIAEIIARKFSSGTAEFDDLKQVGMFAIIKALDRFDIGKNIKLATYLTHCVSGEIKNYFRDTGFIKVSRDIKKLKRDVLNLIADSEKNGEKTPSAAEISKKLGVSVEKIIEAMELSETSVALDMPVGDDGLSLYEIIPNEVNEYQAVENRDFFQSAMKHLEKTEQELIRCRFINELTQAETAKKLGVSQMLVSRLERKILAKLREYV